MRRFLATTAIATTVLTSSLLAPGLAGASGGGTPTPSDQTLAEVLLADGDDFDRNPFDYDVVTQAVLLFPDLVAAASDPDAELTVFLPTDFAFYRLVFDLTHTWPRSERALFDAVAGLGTDTVKTVLTYHIVAGPPISYAAARTSDGATLTTLQGGTIDVKVRGTRFLQFVRLIDQDPNSGNPLVVRPEIGGLTANGYAHGIDRVLRPIDL